MTGHNFDTGNGRRYYDTRTEKVVPKDAVVLDLDEPAKLLDDLNWAANTTVKAARDYRLRDLRSQIEAQQPLADWERELYAAAVESEPRTKVVPADSIVLDLDFIRFEPYGLPAVLGALRGNSFGGSELARQIEQQTKPPRIPEPGLWGVVEAWKRGIPTRRWVHHEEDRWVSDAGHIAGWDELDQAVLIRPGIEDES